MLRWSTEAALRKTVLLRTGWGSPPAPHFKPACILQSHLASPFLPKTFPWPQPQCALVRCAQTLSPMSPKHQGIRIRSGGGGGGGEGQVGRAQRSGRALFPLGLETCAMSALKNHPSLTA